MIACCVAALFIVGGVKSCWYTCDTFHKYVLQCNGKSPDSVVFTFDGPKVRDDFVRFYDLMIVTAAARDNLNLEYDAQRGDKVVDELRRLKMVGVWRAGNTLTISNVFLTDGPANDTDSLAWFADALRAYTDSEHPKEKDELQKGIYGAMTTMFDRVEIRGGKGTQPVTLNMPFALKDDFKTH